MTIVVEATSITEAAEKIAADASACFFAFHGQGYVPKDVTPDAGDKQLASLIVLALEQAGLLKDSLSTS